MQTIKLILRLLIAIFVLQPTHGISSGVNILNKMEFYIVPMTILTPYRLEPDMVKSWARIHLVLKGGLVETYSITNLVTNVVSSAQLSKDNSYYENEYRYCIIIYDEKDRVKHTLYMQPLSNKAILNSQSVNLDNNLYIKLKNTLEEFNNQLVKPIRE
jgi:hypothetical protein